MSGQLFTHYFLTDGITTTSEWQASLAHPEGLAAFRDGVGRQFEDFSQFHAPNEAVTEQELIRPVLELLGWVDYLPQQGVARNEDIPDLLLFPDARSKGRAAARVQSDQRYLDASVVEESKRLGVPLDVRDHDDNVHSGTPHGQILRYLSTADSVADGRLRWGILTNGRAWRLYDYRARPRAGGYFEADLAQLLEPGHEDDLRVFHLLFRRESFAPQQGATTAFLESALAEGRRYEEQVAQDLSGVVFESVFPSLVQALSDASDVELPDIRQAALIFLYRLLFVLYAEDRDLLPVNELRYDDYGLRKRVRDDIARRMADGDTYSSIASNYYDRLVNLFRIIDQGDPSIGLPPYNGGLFASEAAPLLERVRLADATIAPIIYDLSHARESGSSGRRFVNYRDMSVQQLGSIYERLLEQEPVRDDNGRIVIRPNPYARKDSGSFFTPQELVDLIVDRTLKPLVEERLKAFEEKAARLKSDRRPKAHRKAELLRLDPACSGSESEGAGPGHGKRPFPGHRRRLPVGLYRRADRVRPRGAGVARRRLCFAPGETGGGDSPRDPSTGPRIGLGSGRGPAHRPGHHPPPGAQALHLRRGQEPPDRRAGQGIAVAAQLYRGRALVLSGPPPALWRFASWACLCPRSLRTYAQWPGCFSPVPSLVLRTQREGCSASRSCRTPTWLRCGSRRGFLQV